MSKWEPSKFYQSPTYAFLDPGTKWWCCKLYREYATRLCLTAVSRITFPALSLLKVCIFISNMQRPQPGLIKTTITIVCTIAAIRVLRIYDKSWECCIFTIKKIPCKYTTSDKYFQLKWTISVIWLVAVCNAIFSVILLNYIFTIRKHQNHFYIIMQHFSYGGVA